MKLILKTEFENLRVNDDFSYELDNNSGKEVLKLYNGEVLIAKRITQSLRKKSIRYFGVKGYKELLTPK